MHLDPDIYEGLCRTAATVSSDLHAVFRDIGPIVVPPPSHASVADRLFVEVVNQQLSIRAALSIWGRIEAAAARRGEPVRNLFADAERQEAAALLRACGVSGNKVRALQAIHAADVAGLLGLDLAALPHSERARRLCRIRGVGPWTADMIGIFHFLDPDIWPVGDVAAVGTLRRLAGCTDTMPVAAAFVPHRSLLARYLWRSRDAAAISLVAA
jgi:DNA-3-methyladenine glycosylase II